MHAISKPRLVGAYAAALASFLVLDALWLGFMGPRLYQPALSTLMAAEVDWLAAGVFYLLYPVGLLVLAIVPGLERHDAGVAARRGALLGLVAYATYDLTNQATLRDWPWLVTLADLLWGTLLSGASAWIACRLTNRPARPVALR